MFERTRVIYSLTVQKLQQNISTPGPMPVEHRMEMQLDVTYGNTRHSS